MWREQGEKLLMPAIGRSCQLCQVNRENLKMRKNQVINRLKTLIQKLKRCLKMKNHSKKIKRCLKVVLKNPTRIQISLKKNRAQIDCKALISIFLRPAVFQSSVNLHQKKKRRIQTLQAKKRKFKHLKRSTTLLKLKKTNSRLTSLRTLSSSSGRNLPERNKKVRLLCKRLIWRKTIILKMRISS